MMTRLLPFLFVISNALALPPLIGPAATNAGDRSSSDIAPGSFISIRLIGVRPFIQNASTITLIASDGTAYVLPPIVPSSELNKDRPLEVWAVVPPNVKTGTAFLTVQGEAFQTPLRIVETAPALFTTTYPLFTGAGYDSWGGSTAAALNHPSTPIGLTSAAVPGKQVSLFATGLNGATTSDVRVELGGMAIVPIYAGPQGEPGVDQINFFVPQEVKLGCYVPILIRVRGVVSNRTSLPINSDPYACAHPLGLSYGDLLTLDAGGSIPLGLLDISDPGASFSVLAADARTVAMYAGEQMSPTQRFTCFQGTFWPVGLERGERRDIGPAVTLTGPAGRNVVLTGGDTVGSWGYRYINYVTSAELPVFTAGYWQAGAPGGTDLGGFLQSFWLPPVTVPMNLKSGDTISSTRDLTVNWDPAGFGIGDMAKVVLNPNADVVVTCAVPAWTGRVQVPQALLAPLAGRKISVGLVVVPNPDAKTIFPILTKDGSSLRTLINYTFIASEITANVE